jgi:hypothetical protein
VIVLCSLLAISNSAPAQGTAFTYPGRLNAGGSPANGSYDIAFSLYAVNAGGVAIAGATGVTNSFTTSGGTLVIFSSGSGYSSVTNIWIGMSVFLDGFSDSDTVDSIVVPNSTPNIHVAFAPGTVVLSGVAAGIHTLGIRPFLDKVYTSTDNLDNFRVTVLELAF